MRRFSVIGSIGASCLLTLVCLSPPSVRAAAPDDPILTTDDFFDDTVVRDIYLTVATKDWATLKAKYLENTYYPCTFSWNGITVPNSTIRSRGSGTRNPQKPGLRVDFNRYNTAQRFLGLKYFVLDNMWQDGSMLRERVTMLLFGRFGIPVPRETHVRLFINDEYAGLYVAVEALDDVFTGRTLGSNTGYLFEYNWVSEYHFEYLGSDLAPYKAMFDPKTHSKDPDALVWGPIEQMIRAINETPDAIFESEMSNYLDLSLFTKQIALENFMSDSDGLLGAWGLNNFYMYRPEDSMRFQLLEWDKDNTFHQTDSAIMQGVSANVLARRLLQIPAYRMLYADTMNEAAAMVVEGPNRDGDVRTVRGSRGGEEREPRLLNGPDSAGWMEREIRREFNQVRGFAFDDPYKPVTNQEFETAVRQLVDFARRRPEFVRMETDRIRRSGF